MSYTWEQRANYMMEERDAAVARADDLAFQLDGLEHCRRRDNEMFLSMIYAVVDGEGQDHYDGIAAMRKYVRDLRATVTTEETP